MSNLNLHIKSIHAKKTYKCDICGTKIKKGNLTKHRKNVHERKSSEGKKFHCELCDHTFSLKANLNKHISSVHEGQRPFKCKLCDKYFSANGSLKRKNHQRMKTL